MADVTINDLTGQAPTSTDVFPFASEGVSPSTYKATLAQIKTALAITWSDVSGKPSIGTNASGNRTVQSGGVPSGGSDGDIFFIY